MEKSRTCCLTGTWNLPEERVSIIKERLVEEMKRLIATGVDCFLCDGTDGFSAMAAFTALELKERHPHITLLLLMPYRDQDTIWPRCDRRLYQGLLHRGAEVVYLSEAYGAVSWDGRDRFLAGQSAYCISCVKQKTGQQAVVVNLARKQGLTVISIADALTCALPE